MTAPLGPSSVHFSLKDRCFGFAFQKFLGGSSKAGCPHCCWNFILYIPTLVRCLEMAGSDNHGLTINQLLTTSYHSSFDVYLRALFLFLTLDISHMDNVASVVDEWLWLDERAILQAVSKNIAVHMEEELDRALVCEDDDDNWGMVSDSSDYPSASSLLDVVGVVAE